jgi:hypothetical protein
MEPGEQELHGATQAAIQAYMDKILRGRNQKRVLGIDVMPYAGFRMPGLTNASLFCDPYLMLKDGKKMRAEGRKLILRDPKDATTASMCRRGLLRPVTTKEVDPRSPFANVDFVRILTEEGAKEVVRTPKGLGLFEAPSDAELMKDEHEYDRGLLPGEHWTHWYLSSLADEADKLATGFESLSQSSLQGRVVGGLPSGKAMEERDSAMEIVV